MWVRDAKPVTNAIEKEDGGPISSRTTVDTAGNYRRAEETLAAP